MSNKHIGSSFDSFLEEEGVLEETREKVLEAQRELEDQIENAVSELYRVFFNMRIAGMFQQEYNEKNIIISMFREDNLELLKSGKVKL